MQAPHLAAAPIQAGNLSTPCIVRPVNLGFFDSSPLKHAFCSAQLLGVDWNGDWKAEFSEFIRWLRRLQGYLQNILAEADINLVY